MKRLQTTCKIEMLCLLLVFISFVFSFLFFFVVYEETFSFYSRFLSFWRLEYHARHWGNSVYQILIIKEK